MKKPERDWVAQGEKEEKKDEDKRGEKMKVAMR